jgi:hypothetical protein
MLEKEFQFYLNNQDRLVKEYNGKYIVIKGEEVVGAYDSEAEAYFETTKSLQAGTFLIQLCQPGEEAYTETYHSRVAFH